MKTILISLALIGYAYATTTGEHTSAGFCYDDAKSCKPSEWPGVCKTGQRQSPITLPPMTSAQGFIGLDKSAYKGNAFRIQNNGHSIAFDFAGQGPHAKVFTFPDPLNYGVSRQYKFASGHFHWGVSDLNQGSEHCIGVKCAAMELHLVHYLANYGSMAEAVSSGDESALTVVGILISLNIGKSILGGVSNVMMKGPAGITAGTGPAMNLFNSVKLVNESEHDSTKWTTVNAPLDLSPWVAEAYKLRAFTYKGSLTTPGCNEQVNWFVGRDLASTSHQDLEIMRTIPKDGEGEVLKKNYRPPQPLNGRVVKVAYVTTKI